VAGAATRTGVGAVDGQLGVNSACTEVGEEEWACKFSVGGAARNSIEDLFSFFIPCPLAGF